MWNLHKDSKLFVCVRDLYHNVEPKFCPKTDIEDVNSEATESGKPFESINELYNEDNIQYAKSSW